MLKISIIHKPTKEKPYLIIYKPSLLPSAPLSSNDKNNALSQAIDLYPQIKNVKGKKEIEYGLIHRLDTVTNGLMLIAITNEAYEYFLEEQKENKILKYYQAECKINPNNIKNIEGFLEYPNLAKLKTFIENKNTQEYFSVESYFRHFGEKRSQVRPIIDISSLSKNIAHKMGKAKLYKTNIKFLNFQKDRVKVECSITQGFKHQVRCHLAWIGLPIINDKTYNFENNNDFSGNIKFTASKLEFEYPRGDLNSYDCSLGPEPSASANSATRA